MDEKQYENERPQLNNEDYNNLQNSAAVTSKGANYVFAVSAFGQMIIGVGLGVLIFLIAYLLHIEDDTKLYFYFASPITELGAILLPVIFYILLRKLDFKSVLRLNRINFKHILPLVAIGIAAQYAGGLLNYIVIYLLKFLGEVPPLEIPTPKNILELLLSILIIGIIPGVCEELLARGIIMRGYESLGAKRAVIISAFLFGILHFDITNFVFPIFIGLILGYVVYRTNSIFSGMIVHFINNTFGVFMLYFSAKSGVNATEPSNLSDLLSSSIAAAVGFVVIFVSLYYIYKTTKIDMKELNQNIVSEKGNSWKVLLHWPLVLSYLLMVGVIITTVYRIMNGID